MFKGKIKNEIIGFGLALIFMLVPIILWIVSLVTNHTVYSSNPIIAALEHTPLKNAKNSSPFSFELGIPTLMAIVLYTIVLLRNQDFFKQFGNINKVDIKAAILHFFNLVFLITVCSLCASGKVFGLVDVSTLIVFGIIMSFLGMRSISGFVWIILSVCLVINISIFNGWWGAMPYILCSYISLFIQVVMLKYFKFDWETIKYEFFGVRQIIVNDTNKSIEDSKNAVKSVINITKSTIPGGKVVDVISDETKTNIKVKEIINNKED